MYYIIQKYVCKLSYGNNSNIFRYIYVLEWIVLPNYLTSFFKHMVFWALADVIIYWRNFWPSIWNQYYTLVLSLC